MKRPPRTASIASTVLTVVGGVVLYALAPTEGGGAAIGIVLGLAAVAVIVPLTVRRVQAIQTSHQPIIEAAQAIVLLLTLLVFGFASVYVGLSRVDGQLTDIETKIDAVYFAVSTLSTVGFGDAHATGQAARLVVTAQMLFDLVFIAVAIRLVTWAARERVQEVGPPQLRREFDSGP